MKRSIFWLTLVLASLLCSDAYAQYIPITAASCIDDGSGSPMVSGTMIIVGTDASDNPIPYRAGSSLMSITSPITRAITNGSLVTSLQLADPSVSSPTNILYRFAIQDNTTKKITLFKQIIITPNDVPVSSVFTTFNFCKMNPQPFSTVQYGTIPLNVNGDAAITRDLSVGRNETIAGTSTSQAVNKLYNAGGFASISAALTAASAAGAPVVYAPCAATYNDNILTVSTIDLFGESTAQNCPMLQPLVAATDLFKIDATTGGLASGTSFRNFDVNCPSGTCGNIITITGSQTTNQPNDWINLNRIYSLQFGLNTTGTAGFANGVVVSGRTIYSKFQNLRLNGTRGIGFQVISSGGLVGPFNANHIKDTQISGNFSYGLSLDGTGSTTFSEGSTLQNSVIEANANNTALTPCAGALIKGTYIFGFWHNYFEANCNSSADTTSSNIRITGTTSVPYFVPILGNDMLTDTVGPHYNIYADSNRSGGVILANRFGGNATPTARVHIAATTMDSLWEIGVNHSMGKMDIVLDASLNSHVTAPAFGIVGDYTLIGPATGCPTTGGTFDLVNGCSQNHQLNNIALNGATATWSNWTNSIPGSWIVAQAFTANGYTLTNAAGGAGQFLSRDGNNIVLATIGDAVVFRTDGNGNLQEMFRSVVSMINAWSKLQTFNAGAKFGSTGSTINIELQGTASTNVAFTAIAASNCQEQTLTVSGVTTTGFAGISPNAALGSTHLQWAAWPSAANTITIRLCNVTTGALTPNNITWSYDYKR